MGRNPPFSLLCGSTDRRPIEQVPVHWENRCLLSSRHALVLRFDNWRAADSNTLVTPWIAQEFFPTLQPPIATNFLLAANFKGVGSLALFRRNILWQTIWRRRVSKVTSPDSMDKLNKASPDKSNRRKVARARMKQKKRTIRIAIVSVALHSFFYGKRAAMAWRSRLRPGLHFCSKSTIPYARRAI
jgi:hypothetical protein